MKLSVLSSRNFFRKHSYIRRSFLFSFHTDIAQGRSRAGEILYQPTKSFRERNLVTSADMMSYYRRSRYSRSPSPYNRCGRSVSRSLSRSISRSFSRSPSRDAENPGNNLYVTGLSPRVTKREVEKHFASEGKVIDVHLVVDPWTRESRGFGFVTMETVKEADRCIKYLNRSVLEGRVIMVEKFLWQQARRRRGRTPTPGRYLGLRTVQARRRSVSSSPRRSPSYSPYRRSYSRSPYSSDRSRSHSYSPYHSRRRSYSPYYRGRRSYSPHGWHRYYDRHRSYSPYSRSPVSRRDRSYSPYDSRYDRYYRRHRYRSISRSVSPRPRRSSRRYSRSISPVKRRGSRRGYPRSPSPRPRRSSWRRSYSRSLTPRPRRNSRRSYSRSISPRPRGSSRRGGSSKRGHTPVSDRSYSTSPSLSSRSVSRSLTPRSTSP